MTGYQRLVVNTIRNNMEILTDWEQRFIIELSKRSRHSYLRNDEAETLNHIYFKVKEID